MRQRLKAKIVSYAIVLATLGGIVAAPVVTYGNAGPAEVAAPAVDTDEAPIAPEGADVVHLALLDTAPDLDDPILLAQADADAPIPAPADVPGPLDLADQPAEPTPVAEVPPPGESRSPGDVVRELDYDAESASLRAAYKTAGWLGLFGALMALAVRVIRPSTAWLLAWLRPRLGAWVASPIAGYALTAILSFLLSLGTALQTDVGVTWSVVGSTLLGAVMSVLLTPGQDDRTLKAAAKGAGVTSGTLSRS